MKTHKRISIMLFTGIISLLIFGCKKDEDKNNSEVKDIDGNVYKTVKIGNQEWFAENLKTTKYNDGDHIPWKIDDYEWHSQNSLILGAYCWFMNNEDLYGEKYGALYNWTVVNSGKLCPTG